MLRRVSLDRALRQSTAQFVTRAADAFSKAVPFPEDIHFMMAPQELLDRLFSL